MSQAILGLRFYAYDYVWNGASTEHGLSHPYSLFLKTKKKQQIDKIILNKRRFFVKRDSYFETFSHNFGP